MLMYEQYKWNALELNTLTQQQPQIVDYLDIFNITPTKDLCSNKLNKAMPHHHNCIDCFKIFEFGFKFGNNNNDDDDNNNNNNNKHHVTTPQRRVLPTRFPVEEP